MKRGKELFSKAIYIMDRGYDDNKMFCKLMELGQDFVIRLTNRRKLYYKNKSYTDNRLDQTSWWGWICYAQMGLFSAFVTFLADRSLAESVIRQHSASITAFCGNSRRKKD